MKIKNPLNLILIFFILFIGCNSSSNHEELKKNETFNSIFSNSELEEIALILDFFEREICLEVDESSKINCYEKFLEEKHERISKGKLFKIIPIEDQIEMYKSISDSVYQLFWVTKKVVYKRSFDTLESNNINYKGQYKLFLSELSKEDSLVYYYNKKLSLISDIAALIGPMAYSENIFNLKDIRVRFFIAIHYLSVNSLMNSNEIYYSMDTIFIDDFGPLIKQPPKRVQ